MNKRTPLVLLALAVLVAIGIIVWLRLSQPVAAPGGPVAQVTNSNVTAKVQPAPVAATNDVNLTATTNKVYHIRVDQTLATVNGVRITLADLIPLSTTNGEAVQPLDEVTYKFLLDRAVNREVMMQAAKAQGVGLTDAQQQQLERLREARGQPGPDVLAKLNQDSAAILLDLRDAEAFMLMADLMSEKGYNPSVTPEQVQTYYQAHASQFGDPPADPEARKQWWMNVDIAIRNAIAQQTRDAYNKANQTVLDQQKSGSQITYNNPPSS